MLARLTNHIVKQAGIYSHLHRNRTKAAISASAGWHGNLKPYQEFVEKAKAVLRQRLTGSQNNACKPDTHVLPCHRMAGIKVDGGRGKGSPPLGLRAGTWVHRWEWPLAADDYMDCVAAADTCWMSLKSDILCRWMKCHTVHDTWNHEENMLSRYDWMRKKATWQD